MASVLRVSPRSATQCSKAVWASRSSGLKARRDHPPRGSAPISETSRKKRMIRRGSALGEALDNAELLRRKEMTVTYCLLREALGGALAPVEHGDHLTNAGAGVAHPGDGLERSGAGDDDVFDEGDFFVGVDLALDLARRSRFSI